VADSAVATQIHETLDVHGHFPAQITFDGKFPDFRAKGINLFFRQVLELRGRLDTGGRADFRRTTAPDAVYGRQSDHCMFTVRYVDTRYTCHRSESPN
jgi:hypothetical protein